MASLSHQQTEEFLHRYKVILPRLERWLWWRCKDASARKDILEETLVKAWTQFGMWDGERSFKSWIMGILKNEWLAYHRRERRKGRIGQLTEAFDEELHSGAGAVIEAKMDWENIKPVLTGEEQTIVWLHYGEGYSYAEIAEILGKKVGTIRQKGSRTKEKLRSSFPELCGSY